VELEDEHHQLAIAIDEARTAGTNLATMQQRQTELLLEITSIVAEIRDTPAATTNDSLALLDVGLDLACDICLLWPKRLSDGCSAPVRAGSLGSGVRIQLPADMASPGSVRAADGHRNEPLRLRRTKPAQSSRLGLVSRSNRKLQRRGSQRCGSLLGCIRYRTLDRLLNSSLRVRIAEASGKSSDDPVRLRRLNRPSGALYRHIFCQVIEHTISDALIRAAPERARPEPIRHKGLRILTLAFHRSHIAAFLITPPDTKEKGLGQDTT
jgi:hypothetical protein